MNFEYLKFNSFDSAAEILNDDSFDPDVNFFNNNIENLNTPYISHEKIKYLNVNTSALSVLHLNIRSMKKNFESFKLFLSNFNFDFSIICFSETWLDDSFSLSQSLYELPKYKCIHQVRSYGKEGGVSIYINNSLNFKLRPDLKKKLCKKKKNTLISVLYRPPKGLLEPLDNFLNEIFNKTRKSNKNCHISGDFNLNVLDHDNCKNV